MRVQTQRALLGAYKLIKRQRASIEARVTHQLQQNLNDRRDRLGVVAAVFAAAAVGDDGGIRRVIQRATGKWRGSTLFGYTRGDDATFCSSFHCSSLQFDGLVQLFSGSLFDRAENQTTFVRGRKHRRTRTARRADAHLEPRVQTLDGPPNRCVCCATQVGHRPADTPLQGGCRPVRTCTRGVHQSQGRCGQCR